MLSFRFHPVLSSDFKDTPRRGLKPVATMGSLCLFLLAQTAFADWFGDTRDLVGTTVSVRLWQDDAARAAQSIEAVFVEIERIDQLMNAEIESSGVARINREAADSAVETDSELFDLIVRALDISRLTRGAFDITFASVGQHYDYAEGRRPNTETLQRELGVSGYQLVRTKTRKRTIRFLKPGVRISLGGIVRGYAVERGVEILLERNIQHAIVTAGGDSKLLGDNLGEPWVVGIRDPRDDKKDATSLRIQDEAISTSGDYGRYFIEDGQRFHHIIEPATGLPARGVHSATVIGPDAVIADALSTAVFIMGVEDGIALLEALPDYGGLLIDAEGQLHYSDGLDKAALPQIPAEPYQEP